MAAPTHNYWLHQYAIASALATLLLVGIGGLVTSHGVGMAVPDWPTSYGYNMFFFPISKWVGGIFYEHTHRLVATVVGLLVVGLTRWLGGRGSRGPLALVGSVEVVVGLLLLRRGPNWSGAGHFLSGIGGVVLLAAAVWARNKPAPHPLPWCGWLAFGLVQFQGLLGGLRVVLFNDQIGIFHGALAQLFFALMCVIALFTSRWWQELKPGPEYRQRAESSSSGPLVPNSGPAATVERLAESDSSGRLPAAGSRFGRFFLGTTLLILFQLILGATMRHQHAGLAIPDFPLAYGRLWPATDPAAVLAYNQQRVEITSVNPITAFQIHLQMVHRLVAVLIFAAVAWAAASTRRAFGGRNILSKATLAWLGLIVTQVLLGAAIIWSNKAADLATAHVLAGALALASGTILCLIAFRQSQFGPDAVAVPLGVGLSALRPHNSAPRA